MMTIISVRCLSPAVKRLCFGLQHKPLNILRSYASESIKCRVESKEVEVTWKCGKASTIPYEFLRDNCQCPSCFHQMSSQSLTLLPDVLKEAEAGVRNASFGDEKIVIEWNSGHESQFSAPWLKARTYSPERAEEKKIHPIIGLRNVLWGAEKRETMKSHDFEKVINDDENLVSWMKILASEGVGLLKNAPREPGQLRALAKRSFGDLYQTMYGDVFTVKEKPGANNLAYTAGYLALHTDQPYYSQQPGIQFLHCISGSIKNEAVNQLVDGFKVAHDLREEHPETFQVLTTLAFPYEQVGTDVYGEFILTADKTPIGINEYGEIDRISHNYPSRASHMNYPSKETRKLYQAAGVFLKMMYDPKYLVEYQLQEGDILCFHNKRVLHGRTSYDPTVSNRWLEGAYGNWDDFYARLRALKAKLEKRTSQ